MGSSKLIRIIITFINKSIEKVVILITTVIKKGYGIFIYLFIILGIIAIYILFYLFFISDQDLYIDIEVEKASYFEIKVSDSDELRINREIEDISKLIIKNIRQLVIIYDNDTKFQQASINNTNKPIATPLPNVIIAPKNKVLRDIKEVQIIKTNNSKNGFSLKLDGNSIGGYLDADSLNGVTFVFDNCEEHRVFTLISDLVCESSFSLDILEPISIIFSFKNKNNKQEIPIQKGKLLINHVSNDLTNNFSIEVTLFKEDNFKLVDIPVKEICFEKKDEDGNYLPTVEKGLIDIFLSGFPISIQSSYSEKLS